MNLPNKIFRLELLHACLQLLNRPGTFLNVHASNRLKYYKNNVFNGDLKLTGSLTAEKLKNYHSECLSVLQKLNSNHHAVHSGKHCKARRQTAWHPSSTLSSVSNGTHEGRSSWFVHNGWRHMWNIRAGTIQFETLVLGLLRESVQSVSCKLTENTRPNWNQ